MKRDARADGFAVLRTPLLPFDLLEGCSADATGADDLAGDRARFQDRLRAILARPDVRDALLLASPDLAERLGPWVDGGREPDAKLVRAALRYVARMCARPTPFGLMAGTTLGSVGRETRFELAGSARRRTTIDPQFVTALAERLSTDPAVRDALVLRPNTALYEAGGRWRYARGQTAGARRSYELVAADGGEPLRVVLDRARPGATAEQLADVLVAHGADRADAERYVDTLIDAQILEGDLVPPVTGEEPATALLRRLRAMNNGVPEDGGPSAARDPTTGVAEGAARGLSAPRDAINPVEEDESGGLSAPPDAINGVVEGAARGLSAARDALAAIDAGGLGASPSAYDELASALAPLATGGLDPRRSLVAELVRPAVQATVGSAVVDEVARAVQTLATLQPPQRSASLSGWRAAFRARWEDREVPLAEALDEEIGIGFEPSSSPGAEASPAVRGLPWPPPDPEAARFGQRGAHLLRRLLETVAAGEHALVLAPAELDVLRYDEHAVVPDAFAPLVTVSGASRDAIDRGEFRVRLHGASGPSGARLLGRVCHADPALAEAVRQHLRREEALRPQAVFAEIAHLPEGRTGKLIARPVLRDHELEFLGRSGAARDAVFDLSDLLVSVRGDRIVLRSRRLGREVEPRLTSAHNYGLPTSLGAYRFLGALQSQDCADGIMWSWGPLEAAPFLPRVVEGRTVLERARWLVSRDELSEAVTARDDAARWRAVTALRERRRLPRWVALADGDNELALDLESVVAQDTLVRLAASRDGIKLVELWPAPDQLCVTGPEGRYAHELLVPFTRRREPVEPPPHLSHTREATDAPPPAARTGASPHATTGGLPPSARTSASPSAPLDAAPRAAPPGGRTAEPAKADTPRRFLPGSEWLFAKLYTGTATADALLREVVAPLVRDEERWFFIRYGDPDWHLRLRVHGDPARLNAEVLPALHAATESAQGRLWKVELSTYEREQERYGGAEAIALCERIFHADSVCALELLALVGGDAGADARWRLALAGIDRMMDDVLQDADAQHATVRHLREAMAGEHRADAPLRKAIGERFRTHRAELTPLLRPAERPPAGAIPGTHGRSALEAGVVVLERRSAAIAGAVSEVRELAAAGRLEVSLPKLAADLAHMQTNRLLRSAHRAHEMVLYDVLDRLYTARAARARS